MSLPLMQTPLYRFTVEKVSRVFASQNVSKASTWAMQAALGYLHIIARERGIHVSSADLSILLAAVKTPSDVALAAREIVALYQLSASGKLPDWADDQVLAALRRWCQDISAWANRELSPETQTDYLRGYPSNRGRKTRGLITRPLH
jgi:hypothetical protein